MSLEKQKPKETTKERQARNQREYDRLVAEVKFSLEHHSPGLFGWLDDTVDNVSDWLDDGIEWTNDLVDTYIWDTTDKEGNVEKWVRDTLNIPDQETKGFLGEAWDKVNEIVDVEIWDTTDKEGKLEKWVRDTFDIPDQEGKGFIIEVVDKLDDSFEDATAKVKKQLDEVTKTITEGVGGITSNTRDIINNISLALGVGFDAAMAALAYLPDMLTEWKNELADWFTFDVEEFEAKLALYLERMKG